MEMYNRGWGSALYGLFTFVVPVLVVVNVPARVLARPVSPDRPEHWALIAWALVATVGSLLVSRRVFRRALLSYRSASS